MACNLTRGRLVDCKDVIGGIKTVYFVDTYADNIRAFASIGTGDLANTMSSGGFTNWSSYGTTTGSTQTLFKYDLRPDLSSVTVNLQSDPATGTTFFEQTLALTLQKQTAADANQMRLLAYNRAQIFVYDTNNNLYLLGMDNGCDMTSGTIVSGAAKGDMPGYTFGFVAKEKEPQIWLTASASLSAAKSPFDGLGDEAGITIVAGA